MDRYSGYPKSDLCIGGGSVKGISFLGSLEYISRTQKLTINNFYGCSIGSVIGVFYIIGITPLEMMYYIIDMDLKKYWNIDLNKLSDSYSILGGEMFDHFKDVFKKYENENITFKEFYNKYKVNINISTVCLSSRELVVFSHSTHPEIRVFDAMRASCSIPLVFPPVKINKEYYIDGGVKNNGHVGEYIDGYTIILGSSEREKDNLYSYSSDILSTLLGKDKPKSKHTIEIKNKHINLNFSDINYNDKIKLYYSGLNDTKEIMEKLMITPPTIITSCNN